jgi:hypothetical protein
MLGQTVYKKRVDNTTQIEIDTMDILKESIYFVTVEADQSKVTQKLIVKI